MSKRKKSSSEESHVVIDSTELNPMAGVQPELPTEEQARVQQVWDLSTDSKEDHKKLDLPEEKSSLSRGPYSPHTIQGYEDTLKEWKDKSTKMAFIYDYIGDTYRKRVNSASITGFVLTSCISLLALGNLGLSDADYPTISMVLKGVNAAFGVSAAIATGLPRILNWGTTSENCQKYLDSVENLLASIISEQALPVKFRTDPEQYILEKKEKYQAILDSAPNVPHEDYTSALDAYEQEKARLRHDLIH